MNARARALDLHAPPVEAVRIGERRNSPPANSATQAVPPPKAKRPSDFRASAEGTVEISLLISHDSVVLLGRWRGGAALQRLAEARDGDVKPHRGDEEADVDAQEDGRDDHQVDVPARGVVRAARRMKHAPVGASSLPVRRAAIPNSGLSYAVPSPAARARALDACASQHSRHARVARRLVVGRHHAARERRAVHLLRPRCSPSPLPAPAAHHAP